MATELLSVFPTRVGMVRFGGAESASASSFPHASGDGPKPMTAAQMQAAFSPREWGWSATAQADSRRLLPFSPREWGWSVGLEVVQRIGAVFPTRVGMVRIGRDRSRSGRGFPHASGDGPLLIVLLSHLARFSPREWGWSGLHNDAQAQHGVFPTRVGMVHQGTTVQYPRVRFPHASGDGPLKPLPG